MLFAAARPTILNGIEEVITRPDLADRAILLMLAPIAKRQRRPETALWREFELALPRILGALLDAAAQGLQMLPQVRLHRLPRMADFALWVAASKRDVDPRSPSKPLIRTTGATRSRTSSTPTQCQRACASSWPTERNGREAHPTSCRSASMMAATLWPLGPALAGQKVPAHSLAGCVGHRPRFARLGLRSSSAARGGWERGQSG